MSHKIQLARVLSNSLQKVDMTFGPLLMGVKSRESTFDTVSILTSMVPFETIIRPMYEVEKKTGSAISEVAPVTAAP